MVATKQVCVMCGEKRNKLPSSWTLNDYSAYCGSCWQTVVCASCGHHDPKGALRKGRWECRPCQHSKKGRNAVSSLQETCHKLILKDCGADPEREIAVGAHATTRAEMGEVLGGSVAAASTDDQKEEEDDMVEIDEGEDIVAPLSRFQTGSKKHGEKVRDDSLQRHVVVLLDMSGSMRIQDVSSDGESFREASEAAFLSRFEAALSCARRFIVKHAQGERANDLFSVVAFSDESTIACSAVDAATASKALESEIIRPCGQTLYCVALDAAANVLAQKPNVDGHVVLLSDGRPADTKRALEVFQQKFVSHQCASVRIHGIAFGETVESFTPLQQLTCISGGSFTLASCSLRRLCAAFDSVSSTITATRSSASAGSLADEWELHDGEECSPKQQHTKLRTLRIATFEPAELGAFGRRGVFRFQAARIAYRYDGKEYHEQRWNASEVIRRISPCMRGGMRLVYGFRDPMVLADDNSWMVAKSSRYSDEALNDRRSVETHAKSTAVAQFFATTFNERVRAAAGLSKKARVPSVFFVPCFMYERQPGTLTACGSASFCSSAEVDEPHWFAGERYLPGVFLKYNSNNGWVNEDNLRHHEALQAFLHFSFDASGGALLVSDLQGVARDAEVLLTDPQVLSKERAFGAGDLGPAGMAASLCAHRCGPTCRLLGLRPLASSALQRLAGGTAPLLGRSSLRARGGSSEGSCGSWERLTGASEGRGAEWELLSDGGCSGAGVVRERSNCSAVSNSSWVRLPSAA
eukprot:TRINITY_DN14142_c0_g3_i1.p1 TRINITY_DN14142_c0_g3~~TRINITY_DN14142_c0_g3_i1.p1  ORF type:complete len:753 (-),score=110.58 TRINITY_DN14142_c0_g3_i1:73-2331(-)